MAKTSRFPKKKDLRKYEAAVHKWQMAGYNKHDAELMANAEIEIEEGKVLNEK